MEEKELQRLHAATQYTRLLLLKILLKESKGAYAGQLEHKLKEEGRKVERRVVSAHLVELEKHGLVEGKHEIGKERPVTLKIFKITSKGKSVYTHIISFK
jgi:DNA-binding transcriptional ArsR family regulator